MVFQNYALFPHLTVRSNVAFPLEMRNIGKIEWRVSEAWRPVKATVPGVERVSEATHQLLEICRHPSSLTKIATSSETLRTSPDHVRWSTMRSRYRYGCSPPILHETIEQSDFSVSRCKRRRRVRA
jgi:hypothetical protein